MDIYKVSIVFTKEYNFVVDINKNTAKMGELTLPTCEDVSVMLTVLLTTTVTWTDKGFSLPHTCIQ